MNLVRWHTKQKPENVTRRTLSRSEPTNDNGILSESCQEKGKVQTLVILFLFVSSNCISDDDPCETLDGRGTKKTLRRSEQEKTTQIEARRRKNLVVPKRP